ncbi:MAG TPA: EscU/YscU/HrcU family type III secretion system export apparatus switch protein [bacterium]|jgi:flagellar biosynthesis protein|nr:EscU/YscU/HrcU family type III secretion system export apparatus switch protein [bacterium]
MALKDKRQRVVALQYDASNRSAAPKVLAKGQGDLAERILAVAMKEGIPLYRDPELVEVLGQLDVGTQIEPDLYKAVAQVLIFIYKMNQKKKAAIVGQLKKQNIHVGKPVPPVQTGP